MRFAVQLREHGVLTLPQGLRRRYRYGPGDFFSLIDLDGVMVLVPKVPSVAKLASEIEIIRQGAGVSVDALLQAAREDRHGRAP